MKKIFLIFAVVLVVILVFSYFKKTPVEVKNPNKTFSEIAELIAEQKAEEKKLAKKKPEEPPKPQFKNIDSTELEQILRQDDLCAFLKSRSSFKNNIQAFLKLPNPFPAPTEEDFIMKELFEGVIFSEGPASPSALVTSYYNALILAGFLDGVKSPEINYEKANALLLDLKVRDPKNSIYAFFRAAVLKKLGRPHDEIKTEFLDAFQRPETDNFFNAIASYFHDRAYSNPTYYMASIGIVASLPFPSYGEVFSILKELEAENDVQFNQQAMLYGKRMMEPGLEANGEYEGIAWSPVEYAIGAGIMKRAAPSMGMTEEQLNLKKFNELPGYPNGTLDEGYKIFVKIYPQTDEPNPVCNRTDYDKYFEHDYEQFKNFKANHP